MGRALAVEYLSQYLTGTNNLYWHTYVKNVNLMDGQYLSMSILDTHSHISLMHLSFLCKFCIFSRNFCTEADVGILGFQKPGCF